MLRLYPPQKTEKILSRLSPLIDRISADYGVPAACIGAVLYREMTEMDLWDTAADLAVLFFRRADSSTGYAQIFGRVAVRALAFADARGIETWERMGFERPLSDSDPGDVRRMWLRLHRDMEFNLRMGTLNLLAAADEVVGRTDFSGMSPDEMKRAFSRYNASTASVTKYGEAVYGQYLRRGGAEVPAKRG